MTDALRQQQLDANSAASVLKRQGMGRFLNPADDAYAREAAKPLEADEEVMKSTEDIAPPDTPYWWHDKYRPRKPKYFNRVKTGYDWNRYNQTHYDKENPPPKIVQGYKFNVFYPDLIDPSIPPVYRKQRIPGEEDYEIIRFSAGAPYEDIAFKVFQEPNNPHHTHNPNRWCVRSGSSRACMAIKTVLTAASCRCTSIFVASIIVVEAVLFDTIHYIEE